MVATATEDRNGGPNDGAQAAAAPEEDVSLSKVRGNPLNTTFPKGTLGLMVDPRTEEPRVIVTCERAGPENGLRADRLIFTDTQTGTKSALEFPKGFRDEDTFKQIDNVWERLGAYRDSKNHLAWAAKELEKIAGRKATFLEGEGANLNSDFLNKLDHRTRALIGNGPGISRRIWSLENILTGRQVYEIDMSGSPSRSRSWNKMQISIEDADQVLVEKDTKTKDQEKLTKTRIASPHVFVTLQSTDREQPNNFKLAQRDALAGPTSVTLRLGKLEDLEKDGGITRLLEEGTKRSSVLASFIRNESAHQELFRDSNTLNTLLKFSDVHLRSIYNAKISNTTLYGIRATIDAEIANTTFKESKIGIFGRADWRGVRTKKCLMSIVGPQSEFDECWFDRDTQVAGDLSESLLKNNTHWHSNFVACDLSLLRFQEGQYQGLEGLKRLCHLKFTWDKGPVELQNGFMSDHFTHVEDYKLFKKMNRHKLIADDSLLEDLHKHLKSFFHPDDDFVEAGGCGTYTRKVLPNGKVLKGGRFLKVYREDGEELTLYIEKKIDNHSWMKAYIERRGPDGLAKNVAGWAKGSNGLTEEYSHLPVGHLLDVLIRWKFGYGVNIGPVDTAAVVRTAEEIDLDDKRQGTIGNGAAKKKAILEEKQEAMLDALAKGTG